MRWFEKLSEITGRLALLSEDEAVCLAKYAALPGDHVEIGCLWGGTAIIAAMAKQEAGVEGQVYTIDPMVSSWWTVEDPVAHMRVTPEIVRSNFAKFKVSSRVEIVHASSSPWPLPASVCPVTVLIDGDHSFEMVAQDWRNASKFAAQYIMLHDCNSLRHPGVIKALDEVVAIDPKWRYVDHVGSMAVFERVAVPRLTEPIPPTPPSIYKLANPIAPDFPKPKRPTGKVTRKAK